MITFQKQFGSQYEFRFFGEDAPDMAAKLSITGLFENSIMQSVQLVADCDMSNKHNRNINLAAHRRMIAKLILAARKGA